MKNLFSLILVAFIFSSLLFSCKKDKETNMDIGYNYFPTDVGRYVIYDVDSSRCIARDSFLHYKLQVKEKIESIYNDNQNRPTIRLERSVKYFSDTIPYSAMTWTLKDVWAENLTNTTAEKVEENIRIIKLAFPIKENQTWNANAQNTLGSHDYDYEFFDSPRTVNSISFDSVLQVNQLNSENLIEKHYEEEKFARNVGLIYKAQTNIYSQCIGCSTAETQAFLALPILQRITSGLIYTMSVNSYGIE